MTKLNREAMGIEPTETPPPDPPPEKSEPPKAT